MIQEKTHDTIYCFDTRQGALDFLDNQYKRVRHTYSYLSDIFTLPRGAMAYIKRATCGNPTITFYLKENNLINLTGRDWSVNKSTHRDCVRCEFTYLPALDVHPSPLAIPGVDFPDY